MPDTPVKVILTELVHQQAQFEDVEGLGHPAGVMVCPWTLDVVGPALLPLRRPTQEDLSELEELLVVAPRKLLHHVRFQPAVHKGEKVWDFTVQGFRNLRESHVIWIDGAPGGLQDLKRVTSGEVVSPNISCEFRRLRFWTRY